MSRVCKCVVAIALSLAMALPGAAGAEGGMAYGDRGESVRAMQNRLTELGFSRAMSMVFMAMKRRPR